MTNTAPDVSVVFNSYDEARDIVTRARIDGKAIVSGNADDIRALLVSLQALGVVDWVESATGEASRL